MVTFFLIMRFFVISYRPSSAVRDMVNILIIFRKCIWFSYRIPLNHIPLNSYENRKFLQKYFCPNSVYWGLKGNIRNEFCYCSNFLFYVKFWSNLHVKYKNDWLICFIYLNIFRITYSKAIKIEKMYTLIMNMLWNKQRRRSEIFYSHAKMAQKMSWERDTVAFLQPSSFYYYKSV